MKYVDVTVHLRIDELGRTTVTAVDYITRGQSEAVLFKDSTEAENLPTTEEVEQPMQLAQRAPSADLLALLASVGLRPEEVEQYAATKTERRIRDVVTWIRHKNGVASPAGLARKLFAVA